MGKFKDYFTIQKRRSLMVRALAVRSKGRGLNLEDLNEGSCSELVRLYSVVLPILKTGSLDFIYTECYYLIVITLFQTISSRHWNINITHHRHFTLVYLFGDNLTTVDTGAAREPSIYLITVIVFCSFFPSVFRSAHPEHLFDNIQSPLVTIWAILRLR